MPIYEYQCMKCGAKNEFFVRSSDTDELRCKNCESTDLYKLMSASNFSMSSSTPSVPCLLYTSPSPRDRTRSRMPSSA